MNFRDEMPAGYNYNRRRSRAVLYHLSGHLKQQEKRKRRKLKLNSVSSVRSYAGVLLSPFELALDVINHYNNLNLTPVLHLNNLNLFNPLFFGVHMTLVSLLITFIFNP